MAGTILRSFEKRDLSVGHRGWPSHALKQGVQAATMALDRLHRGLWWLFCLQALCAIFFLFDAIVDFFGLIALPALRKTDSFEYVMASALILSLVFTGILLRLVALRQQRMADQLKVASGAFAELLEEHFTQWNLTKSERDVALLAIKGFSIAEMAGVRDTMEGTIKAQCNAIYRKAGVSGRPQLLSLFIDELMAETLTDVSALEVN